MKLSKLTINTVLGIFCFSGLSASSQTPSDESNEEVRSPILSLSVSEIDFDEISPDDSPKQTVKVSNVGEVDLEITSVASSCTCTTVSIRERSIRPGDFTFLEVSLLPYTYPGSDLVSTITITSNDPLLKSAAIEIRAKITPEYIVAPREIDFGVFKKGQLPKREVIIRGAPGVPLKILSIDTPRNISVSTERLFTDRRKESLNQDDRSITYKLSIAVLPNTGAGRLREKIKLHTNIGRFATYAIPIYGMVEGVSYSLRPKVMALGSISPGQLGPSIELSGKNLEVLKAECDVPNLELLIETLEEESRFKIVVKVKPEAPQGFLRGRILLTVKEDELVEQIELGVFGKVIQ